MNLIIPMGGQGKRLRPHTLTVPKPLLPIAGKFVVERIVEEIFNSTNKKIDNIGYVVSDLSKDSKAKLIAVADKFGAKPHFYYQDNPLGTAHAISCAKELLNDEVLIIFADTLFKSKFDANTESDGIIWTKYLEDPSSFGVVTTNENNEIESFVEKPTETVSNEAMVGLYYFKDGALLRKFIQNLIDTDSKTQGEYQLTQVLKNMITSGVKFVKQSVDEWLDCGNKFSIIETHQKLLNSIENPEDLIHHTSTVHNTIIIHPVYIGENTIIQNSVIGPHVSIGNNTNVYDSRIQNSIVQSFTNIKNMNLKNAMLGSYVNFIGKPTDASIGDYSSTIIT